MYNTPSCLDKMETTAIPLHEAGWNDTSDYDANSHHRLSSQGYQTTGVILVIIALLGIFTNLSVVAVMALNRHLRTPVNLMLVSLSSGDLIIALFGTPLTAGAAFAGKWIYGRGLCVTYGFCMALTGIASIVTLAVISLERYVLVTRTASVVITTRKTVLAILAVWIYAFLVTFPPVIGWSSIVVESPGIACAPDWESTAPQDLAYEIYLLIFGLVVPLAAIIWCYCQIILFVHRQAQTAAGRSSAKSQVKLTRMVALMVICFLVAWLPYALVSIIVMAGGKHTLTATATAAPALLAKSSLIYNPIIYAFMNPQIRTAYLALLTCRTTTPEATARQLAERPRELPLGFSAMKTSGATALPSPESKKPSNAANPTYHQLMSPETIPINQPTNPTAK